MATSQPLRLVAFPKQPAPVIPSMTLEAKLRELLKTQPDEFDVIDGMVDRLLATARKADGAGG